MIKLKNTIYILGFLFIIYIMGILFLISPIKINSIFEKRALAQKPIATTHKVLKGKYFSEFDNYLSDQIFGRSTLVKYYTNINLNILGKKKINNIVIGKNGYLLSYNSFSKFGKDEEIKETKDTSKMVNNILKLKNYINSYGGQFYFIGIPNQISYERNQYPKYFYNESERLDFINQEMFLELKRNGIKSINMNDVFKTNNLADVYFKTDHHYNFNGAFQVYQATMAEILKQNNIKATKILNYSDFNVTTLKNPFLGSKNLQLYGLYKNNDSLQIGYPKQQINYEKSDGGNLDNRLYYLPKDEKEEISYGVYMGGDNAETVIKTHRSNLDNALIFGDSYTNAVEPLLAFNFNETRILDLRYYKTKSLYTYIKENKPKAVIMMRDDESYTLQAGNGNFNGNK